MDRLRWKPVECLRLLIKPGSRAAINPKLSLARNILHLKHHNRNITN